MAAVEYEEPTKPSSSPPPSASQWGPYTNARDFRLNMVVVLLILLCAFVLALALHAVIKYLLHALGRHISPEASGDPEKGCEKKSLPTLVYTQNTKLVGTEAECSICLADFVDGDGVKVLPHCGHGFHVACIDKWILSKKSCPTCRACCDLELIV